MAASKQAYTHFGKCSHASVGLAQARPNNRITVDQPKIKMPDIMIHIQPFLEYILYSWVLLFVHLQPKVFHTLLRASMVTTMSSGHPPLMPLEMHATLLVLIYVG